MARSTVKQNTILQKTISVAGVEVMRGNENDGYYVTIDISNELPQNALIVAVNWSDNWTQNITVGGFDKRINFSCPKSVTIGSPRNVVVSYIMGGNA